MTTIGQSAYAPMAATYRNWLRDQAIANPVAAQQARYGADPAQLAYWSLGLQSADDWTTGTNPFAEFLGGNIAAQGTWNPMGMTAGDWATRAGNVGTTLGLQGNDLTEAQMSIQDRFGGIGGDTTAQQAIQNQAALVNQAVLGKTPMALRGETSNILQRLFDQWYGQEGTDENASYLNWARTAPGGAFARFNVPTT